MKATVSGVVGDLKFRISESSGQNWCFPDFVKLAVSVQLRQLTGQSQENTNFGCSLLKGVSMEFNKSSKHQHINVMFLISFQRWIPYF